jgi:excisionase family DNA binding protein
MKQSCSASSTNAGVPSQAAAFYTVEEAASLAKHHPESIRRLIRQRRIPATRFGRRAWRIPASFFATREGV